MKRSPKRKITRMTQIQEYCMCFSNEDPYDNSRNTRTYVIIIKGKICCELCQYPLDQVKIKFDRY